MSDEKLPKRILCPVDESEEAIAALSYSGLLARSLGAELHVMHAYKMDVPLEFLSDQAVRPAAEARVWQAMSAREVREFAERYVGGVPFELAVVEKDVVAAITGRAEEIDADLIVLGTHGRSGLARIIYGSIAEEVVRNLNRAVLVVRARQKPAGPPEKLFKKVLCPVNFTEVAREALEYAAAISARYGADLVAAYAVEQSAPEQEESARALLQSWAPDVAENQRQCQLVVRHGDAAEQIIELACEIKADLIVIGAQKRPFLQSVLFGTTTERVMRHAPCPLLVVPRPPAVQRTPDMDDS